MRTSQQQILPIGIQNFATIRNEGMSYVDKTYLIYVLAQKPYAYLLSRPRRFGKSLLLDTMQAYFEGKKELFEGLAIMDLEKDWVPYPVIRLDLSLIGADTEVKLENGLQRLLVEEFNRHNLAPEPGCVTSELMFGNLIEQLYKTTGKGVVVLVDEYDKGLVDVLRDEAQLEKNTTILRPFFSQIKGRGGAIRFTFITGVARFRHVTIFSGLNNLKDISLDPRYAEICGFTQEELKANFGQAIQALAQEEGESVDATLIRLKQKYDGYRFTQKNLLVYNPFSLVNCLDELRLANYWAMSGTSKILVDFLKDNRYTLAEIDGAKVTEERLGDIYNNHDPIPLFYQTGYLTICEAKNERYTLTYPNAEVKQSLLEYLVPEYMGMNKIEMSDSLFDIKDAFLDGDIDAVMHSLQSLLGSVPYHLWDNEAKEKTYHRLVHMFFMMTGVATQSERAVSGGRIDLLCQTPQRVYIFEFKLDGTPEEALAQIDDHGYPLAWSADGREVYKIGVSFSSDKRNITSWLIARG
ncbi:MAG: ATP-binding protein [Bacteroidales bacterium]|nr:ATP-binding protein [Bacteroidales bacterium]MCD8394632.1 ATP-binding protein [Bacteroidales bacterium]